MTEEIMDKLARKDIEPLGKQPEDEEGERQYGNRLVWFIPRSKEVKTTKNGKPYWIITAIDSSNMLTEVKCWGIRETDVIHMNRPYLAQITVDSFGNSIRSFKEGIKLLA